jgi:hypothetical protein
MDEQPDSYDGKKGRVDQWKVLCLDWSDGHRCKTMLEFTLPADQAALKGLLKDGFADLIITEMMPGFGGSVRVRGVIQPVRAEAQKETKKAA